MKTNHYILLLLSLCSFSAFAQRKIDTSIWNLTIKGTDTLISLKDNPGDKALNRGDFEFAKSFYLQMLKENPKRRRANYTLSRIYSLTGKPDSAFYYLDIAGRKDSSVSFLVEPDFYPLINDPRWRDLEARQIELYETKYGKFKNRQLSQQLWKMRLSDQAYYRQLKIIEIQSGHKKAATDSLWEIKKRINSENLVALEKIVDLLGWPKVSEVGSPASQAAFLVVQHADYDTQKKYKPLIEEAANKNEASWEQLALLVDRILVHENKPQVYGSQVTYNEKTKQYEPSPIADEHNLDIRRKKVGLESASSYYASWNINYTVEQNKE